jgi:cell division protein FtsB
MEQNQALEKKNQGTKARVTILENEIKKLKENLTVSSFHVPTYSESVGNISVFVR